MKSFESLKKIILSTKLNFSVLKEFFWNGLPKKCMSVGLAIILKGHFVYFLIIYAKSANYGNSFS